MCGRFIARNGSQTVTVTNKDLGEIRPGVFGTLWRIDGQPDQWVSEAAADYVARENALVADAKARGWDLDLDSFEDVSCDVVFAEMCARDH